MINLAGHEDCDHYIRAELTRARIPVLEVVRVKTEVPYSLIGELGGLKFTRAWYYWVAKGLIPLDVAEELYADPVGITDIRVAGHAGCPPPAMWSRTTAAGRFVESYHIDSEIGLRVFADIVKASRLDVVAA